MRRKKPGLPEKKLPEIPGPQLQDPKQATKDPSTGSSKADFSDQDARLAALRIGEDQAAPPGVPPGQAAAIEAPIPEVYYRTVPHVSRIFVIGMNRILRPIGQEFLPITEDQTATFEEDAAWILKQSVDKILPQIAKDHPRVTALVLAIAAVCAENIRPVKPGPAPPGPGQDGPIQPKPNTEHKIEVIL